MKSNKLVLVIVFVAILFIAFALRFWKLETIPNGLYVDEAAVGVNAYSFLKTGLDEYGKSWPVFMRLFGAFSSPLYYYLTAIPIKIFGLSVFSVRYLSAFFGSLSVIIVYLILRQFNFKHSTVIPLLGAFMYAISPWAVFLSRMGTEGHLGFFFVSVGILALMWGFKKPTWTIVSAIFLGLAAYTYQPFRLSAVLIIFGYMCLLWSIGRYRIWVFFNPKYLIAATIFILFQIPQLDLLRSAAFSFRANGLVYHERLDLWIREYFSQFIAYFSPKNLFILGDEDPQRSIPTLGVFYSWQVVPYFLGIINLVRKKASEPTLFILWTMIVFAAVPALTRDPFSTVRSQGLLIPFSVIFCFGLDWLLKIFGTIKTTLSIILLCLISLVFLWRGYFVLLPFERARTWNYGYNQLVEEMNRYPTEKVVIDQSRTIPIYEEILFFDKYSPEDYHKTISQEIVTNYYDNLNFDLSREFGRFEIRPIYWKGDVCRKLILVGDSLAVSEEQAREHYLTKLFEVFDPNHELIFRAWQTNPEKSCKN